MWSCPTKVQGFVSRNSVVVDRSAVSCAFPICVLRSPFQNIPSIEIGILSSSLLVPFPKRKHARDSFCPIRNGGRASEVTNPTYYREEIQRVHPPQARIQPEIMDMKPGIFPGPLVVRNRRFQYHTTREKSKLRGTNRFDVFLTAFK